MTPTLRAGQTARCLALLLVAAAARAEDWPQFRGPSGQGHSTERGLPLEWSESRGVRWKTPVPGSGWSSPVVANGRVWLTTAIDEAGSSSIRALAFDVETGRQTVSAEVFRIPAVALLNLKNSRASPTPIVDGDRVYVHFGADGTAALTTSGEIVWKTRLPYASQHGSGGSAIVHENLLILSCDGHDTAFVVALDKQTGKVGWKTPRRRPWDQAYSTPLVIRVGDRDQVVSVGAYRAAAYDPRSGKEIWRVSYGDGFSNVPRPVYGHGLVYIATGFQQPSLLAVRADGAGDVTKTHVAWVLRRGVPHTPSPLLVGAELYIVSDLGVASCLDALTGAVHWQQRLGGNYSASPVFADDRIYFVSEEGVSTVIAPGKEFRPLAKNRLDGATLASMAVSGGSIFIRTGTHLYRIGEAQAAGDAPQAVYDRAVSDFVGGRIAESIVGFDNLARLVPRSAPRLWQRGIALYYAGRYKDCRAQFEAHRTVNPDDVENAAWHFLCVAREETPDKARAALLPVGPDSRVPMRQVYEMLRGSLAPEEVLAAAGARPDGEFYAHLYVGLYADALGNTARALKHVTAAADDRYAQVGGYMHAVARIHLDFLRRRR